MIMCHSNKWHTKAPKPPIMPYIKRVKQITPQMRKIESQMIAAIKEGKCWRSGNTQVLTLAGDSTVLLHGNKIAEIDDCSLKLFDGGYQSTTTKSRLNALLSEFGYTCGTKREYVFQKQYEWFIQMFDLTEEAMRTIPFTNGMRLAG